MNFNSIELIGIVASILVIFSMLFKTSSYKGTIAMRIVNCFGSATFTVYGFLLPAYSTAIANATLFVINVVYLFVELRIHKLKNIKK